MEEYDYLMDALHKFNTNYPHWYDWKTQGDMTYENIKIIKEGATMPPKAEVEAKIKELKDADAAKANNKNTAITKLKSLGLSDDEINALRL